jgi:ABC-type phosphate transport system substrate-binding protein
MLRVLGLIVMVGVSALGLRADDPPFLIVVHRSNPAVSMTRAELSAIYMKRKSDWQPVDQPASARVRERFSRAVHGKSVAYVTRYWQRLIFSGRGIPPRQLPSDAAVIEFVKNNPNAIGYIAAGPAEGVKVITVTR